MLGLASFAAHAVETTFTGFTNGCFGLACGPSSDDSPQTITLLPGLTYNNSTFSGAASGGFLALGSVGATTPAGNVNNLGSFTLSGDPANYNGNSFELLVTFTAPDASPSQALFTDTITGSVTAINQGGVYVDFDNTAQHFTFGGGGSFSFFANDVSLTAGQTIAFSGTILVIEPRQTTPVPEPGTYALLIAGLVAIGFMARRRKR